MSVYLSVCSHISKSTSTNFIKLFVHVIWSVRSFLNDSVYVIYFWFPHNGDSGFGQNDSLRDVFGRVRQVEASIGGFACFGGEVCYLRTIAYLFASRIARKVIGGFL